MGNEEKTTFPKVIKGIVNAATFLLFLFVISAFQLLLYPDFLNQGELDLQMIPASSIFANLALAEGQNGWKIMEHTMFGIRNYETNNCLIFSQVSTERC